MTSQIHERTDIVLLPVLTIMKNLPEPHRHFLLEQHHPPPTPLPRHTSGTDRSVSHRPHISICGTDNSTETTL